MRDLFIENVGLHLRSDVPVGAALSGGIDSSAVVMAMRHIQGHQLDLHTFTYVADDPSINEENWADIAGLAAQATMHKVQPGSDDLIAGLDRLINVQGEPFGSTSIFAQSCIYKLVNKTGIKVTLDGQGADEMLAGYPSYYAARFASLIRQGHPVQALEFLKCAASQGNMSAMKILLRGGQYLLPAQLNGVARGLVGEGLIPTWMNGAWFEKRGVNPQRQQSTSGKNILRDELANTLLDKTIPALLRYQDRSAMSYSVECRVPFLTTKMAEFLFSLPEEFLISKKGETKAVFRQAMRGIVPDAILDRKDKIGFATPQQHWLGANKAWLSDALECGDHLPVFNNKGFKAEQQRLLSGEQRNDSAAWRWINFTKWAAMFEVEFDA